MRIKARTRPGHVRQPSISELIAYAEALVQLYLQAHQKVEILESLATADITDRLQNSHGANAFDALVNILIEDIIRSACAFALDQAPATPSVINTWRLADQVAVLSALRERFVMAQSTNPAQGRRDFGDTRTPSQRFDDAVVRLRQTVPAVTAGPLAQKFVTARNKGVAHHEMRNPAGATPRRFDLRNSKIGWEGLREFVESLAPLVSDLALIITGTDYRILKKHEHHRQNVEDFWARIMGNRAFAPP